MTARNDYPVVHRHNAPVFCLSISDDELRNSNAPWFKNHKPTVQPFSAFGQQLHNSVAKRRASCCWITDQNDSRVLFGGSEDKLTEILIFREQQTALRCGGLHHFLVDDTRHRFHDRNDVMPGRTDTNDDGEVAALVSH